MTKPVDRDLEQWRAEVLGKPAVKQEPVKNGNGKKRTLTRDDLRYQVLSGAIDVVSGARGIGGVPWPWKRFNEKIGPLVRGRLYVIGARPSNAKTSALLSLLSSLHAVNCPTMYFGTEMEPETLLTKWALSRLGLPEALLAHFAWDRLTPEQRKGLETEIEALSSGPVIFPRCLGLDRTTLGKWLGWAFGAMDGAEPRVVILDHLHQLRPEGREDENKTANRAIHALKDASVQRRVSMVVASQLTRPFKPSKLDLFRAPSLSQFKGASAIEECGDLALGQWRLLRSITQKEERAVERGELPLADFVVPNRLGVLCLKSRFLGELATFQTSLEVQNGLVRDPVEAPEGAGDSWEEPELPF